MNSELKRQEKVLDAVTDHTDRSAYELQNVSQQAKKDFKVRPGAPEHPTLCILVTWGPSAPIKMICAHTLALKFREQYSLLYQP